MALPSTLQLQRPNQTASELAANPLNLRSKKDRHYLTEVLSSERPQAKRRWKWWNQLAEVHYPVSRVAKIAGHARFQAVHLNSDGSIAGEHPDERVRRIVGDIYSFHGGVRGLIERFVIQSKVPASTHLIRVKRNGDHDGYQVLSSSELGIDGSPLEQVSNEEDAPEIYWNTLPASQTPHGTNSSTQVKINRADYIGRIWVPSPQWIDLPESPLESLDLECETLRAMTLNLRSALYQRFVLGGIFFIPNTITALTAGDITAVEGDQILAKFKAAFSRNYENWDTAEAGALAPMLLRGDPEAGEKLRHMILGREILETDIKLRAELSDRILYGLDINVPAAEGGTDLNHFGAWAASSDELRLAVQPDLEGFCWALTRMVLYPELRKLGLSDNDIAESAVSYDLSEASVRANMAEDSRQSLDRGMIADSTYRRKIGFNDEDAPDEDEYTRRVGWHARNPMLMMWGKENYKAIPWDEVARHGTTGRKGGAGEDPSAGPGVGDPGSPDDSDTDTPRRNRPA